MPDALYQAWRCGPVIGSQDGDRGDAVGADGTAKRGQIGRIPGAALVFRQPLVDPPGGAGPGKDVEPEDVRHFVREQAQPSVGGLIGRKKNAVSGRIGE